MVLWVPAAVGAPPERNRGAAPTSSAEPPLVVARVGGDPIYAGEVRGELRAILKDRQVEPAARPQLEAQMLAQLIDRRLVLAYLKSRQQTVDPKRVEARIRQMASLFKQNNSSLEAYLADRGVTLSTLEAELNWGMSWQDYIARHVTDELLQKHFESHRRDYDGTEVRVAQLLLAPPREADAAAIEALKSRAAAIRQQIVSGKVTFDDAVARHSAAPSKENGGDLGFLARHGAMPEAIAAAAFALDKGQMSQPIVTRFGVHLLRAAEIKPGQKTWRDVAAELKTAVVEQGFHRIADAQRGQMAVEFTGAMPHLDPKTGRLVAATAGR